MQTIITCWVTVNFCAGDHHTYEDVDIKRSVTLTVNSAINEVIEIQSCSAYDVIKGSVLMEHNPAYDVVVQVEQI